LGYKIRTLGSSSSSVALGEAKGTSPPAFGIPLSTQWRGGKATAEDNGNSPVLLTLIATRGRLAVSA